MSTNIPCQFTGCTYKAEHPSEAVAIAMFTSHVSNHQQQSTPATSVVRQKVPKIDRPELKQDINDEEWYTFNAEWKRFKRCTDIPDGEVADQLFQCCERSLGRLLLKENPGIIEDGEDQLMEAMRKMAVLHVAISVRRAKLLTTKQEHGQSCREYYANVRAAAATCQYTVKCPHPCCDGLAPVNYSSLIVKDVLVAGIADGEVRKDLLGWNDLDKKSDREVVEFVEEKEIALNAYSSSHGSTAGMSAYQKLKKEDDPALVLKKKLALKGKCMKCKSEMLLYKQYRSGKVNKEPYKLCFNCFKENRPGDVPKHNGNNSQESENKAIFTFISSVECSPQIVSSELIGEINMQVSDSHLCGLERVQRGLSNPVVMLDHYIFREDGWSKISSFDHPTLRLRIMTNPDDYSELGVTFPRISPKYIDVVADSGAQSCLWSRKEYCASGFSMKDLIPVHHSMKAANCAPITIDGAIILRLSGNLDNGSSVEAAVMVYVSPEAKSFYLSREALTQLGVIPKTFPKVGAVFAIPDSKTSHVATANVDSTEDSIHDCPVHNNGCPERTKPRERPKELPFECCPENNNLMKEWILKEWGDSTFNKCHNQTFPKMSGPSLKLHVDPNAKPVNVRTPASIPLHWQDEVKRDIDRDIKMGVLEKVPYGEATDWLSRMVVVRKENGGPRRVVDLTHLNKQCRREAHPSKSPFHLARSVPHHSYKTVFDAWNGFHAITIFEEDRHYTAFVTPWGIYRYIRAPQGFMSSGDGYNKRFDDICAHIDRLERCVDDSLIHDNVKHLADHWWRVIDFVIVCGNAGIVLNPEKFQFAGMTVDFAGFRITADTVEPLPKYLDAIRDYPTPKNTTDIRSWFGLVNQVSHYSQLRNMMEPFRKFLSPRMKFEWSEELNELFENSKKHIVDAVINGVQIFDPTRRTALRTDFSAAGVGFWLLQKHCVCTKNSPGCCENGWRIVLAGSRFLRAAERNYAAIEGEALAAAWSLEQTRYFTMGCNDLVVVVDHAPLVKILGDKRLDEINNTRLFRLKQRTLMWKFDVEYQPGKMNHVADAVSRHPTTHYDDEISSVMVIVDEASIIASVTGDLKSFFAITWDRVLTETKKDESLKLVLEGIHHGFPPSKKDMPDKISSFWDIKDDLCDVGGVVTYMDRIVIPLALRQRVIDNLHSAHQGVSGMFSRAQSCVFWPGITVDIDNMRDNCRQCHTNAPSQQKTPPQQEPRIPKVPFEMICADYFQLKGKHYLVIGDRLSGWPEVVEIKPGSGNSGAKGLCGALRHVFVTFGVPEELSSDGGPEFIAGETEDFFNVWGVSHRTSSVYFPQSNGRAELAVKSMKRLLENNVAPDGNLNTDKFVRAMLQYRNTPDRDCQFSSAEILFGRKLRDAMPQMDKSKMVFDNQAFRPEWRDIWAAKEQVLFSRLVKTCEALTPGSKELPPLREGDNVLIQNQDKGSKASLKWDRQGVVVKVGTYDQYLVRVKGTGRLTLRNRRFLRKYQDVGLDCDVSYHRSLPEVHQAQQPHSISTPVKSPVSGLLPAQFHSSPEVHQAQQPPSISTPVKSPVSGAALAQLPDEVLTTVQPATDVSIPGTSTIQNYVSPPPCEVPMTPVMDDADVRRSTRTKRQRKLYDAHSGTYV